MRTKYKPWAKPFIEEHVEVMCPFDNLNNFKNYYLEIGSGKGQFLVNMAINHPDIFFIGMERNVTCAGFTAKKLVEKEVNNAKLVYKRYRFDPWVRKIPCRRAWESTPAFLPGESPGTEVPGRLQSMGSQSQARLSH